MLRNILRRLYVKKEIAVALIALLAISALPFRVSAGNEDNSTLYLLTGIWGQNTVTANKLDNSLYGGLTYTFKTVAYLVGDVFDWSLSVYLRHRNGTTHTLFTYSAIVSITITEDMDLITGYETTKDNTMSLSANKSLMRSSSLYLRPFVRKNAGTWSALFPSTFTTAGMGALWLNASVWTVHYHLGLYDLDGSNLDARINIGDSSYDTHVSGFLWAYDVSEAGESELPIGLAVGGLFAGFVGVMVLAIRKRR